MTEKIGFFSKLKNALTKSSAKISSGISNIFSSNKIDEASLEQFEELLISADLGAPAAAYIINKLKSHKFPSEINAELVKQQVALIIQEMLGAHGNEFDIIKGQLNVVALYGINGGGKTTSAAKLASLYKKLGFNVAIAACDTFRAAASEQLAKWGEKIDVPVIASTQGADSASVAFKAIEYAKANEVELLILDTAGRLQNKKNLMDELSKLVRVIKKQDPNAPHYSLIVLDATIGQNAFSQVEHFKDAADITGIIVTKLDGTAKAGAVVGIVKKFELPIYFIGVGEGIDDFKQFDSKSFVNSLIGIENGS